MIPFVGRSHRSTARPVRKTAYRGVRRNHGPAATRLARLRAEVLAATAPETRHLGVAETIDNVVIDHAHGLHVGVDDGRPDEVETPTLEVLAEPRRLLGDSGDLRERRKVILPWLSSDESPLVGGEATQLVLELQEGLGILDGGLDLQPVADNAWVSKQFFHLAGGEAGDTLGLEALERFQVRGAFAEDRAPAEPCLGAFEDQELEQEPIIINRNAPLLVVIAHV